MLSVAMLLSSCTDKNLIDNLAPAAATPSHASWDRLADGDALRAAEQAYRACAHEAALRHLPVREFPETSERVTYLTQDGKRLKRSEQTEVAIDNMHVDNGCTARVVKSVSVDVASEDTHGGATVDETGRTVARDLTARELPPGQAVIQLAISRKSLPAPACTLMRDVSLQSHFMMLNLCWHEERRAEEAQQEELLPLPKKAATPTPSS